MEHEAKKNHWCTLFVGFLVLMLYHEMARFRVGLSRLFLLLFLVWRFLGCYVSSHEPAPFSRLGRYGGEIDGLDGGRI